MKDSKNQNKPAFISIEEQQKEASQDATGRIKRYLQLAEKLFQAAELPTADAA